MKNTHFRGRLQATTFFCILSLCSLAQADVIVIDAAGGPGADFTDLSGLDAARDGDLVLIRAGVYSGFFPTIDGRGFTIQAEAGALVQLTSGLAITNLGAAQCMSVRGIEFSLLGLRFNNCAGPVLFEQCELRGAGFLAAIEPMAASSCAALSFTRCDIGWGNSVQAESHTVDLQDSSLFLFDSQVRGLDLFGSGLSAIRASDSTIMLSGSTVFGGAGAAGILGGPMGCTNGAAGSTAITLLGSSSVQQINAQVIGGAGGLSSSTSCSDGAEGADFMQLGTGAISSLAGPTLSLEFNSPVRGGDKITRTLSGPPGDRVWLLYASAPALPVSLKVFDGLLFLDPTQLTIMPLGALPASGVLQDILVTPPLLGVSSLQFHTQGLLLSSSAGRFIMGTPSLVNLLDPSI